jgi:trehalose/maltose hydrolase-like predicted phosphorylase
MITEQTFPVEPWQVRETKLDLNLLAQSESVFALSNGHIGLRGNLDEGEPYGLPGTYLNSFYETRPLPYAEAGYSYPEDGQSSMSPTARFFGCSLRTNRSTSDTGTCTHTNGCWT